MAIHRTKNRPRRKIGDKSAPQISALKQQYKVAAAAPAPTVFMPQSELTAGALRVPENTAPVQAIGWDLYGLNLRQLREIKALGFDAVIMNCLWETVQPAPDKWEWGRFRRYADDAHTAGLQLIFRGPLAAPFWLDESFGFRDRNGKASYHGVSGRLVSFWNREGQRRIDDFLQRAYDALHLSQFWALEVSCGQGGECLFQSVRFNADGGFDDEIPLWCFDEHALRAFRHAMRARYNDDLIALNRAANRQWRSWNDVMPATDIEQATYFGDTLSWYQNELLRYIDGMIHRLQPHRRIVLSHAVSLDYAPRFWGSGGVELDPKLWELSARWRTQFVDVLHFYYSMLTCNDQRHFYYSHQMANGHPTRSYAGVEYADNALQNAPLIQRMGCYGMICGVNDHLYNFHGDEPTTIIASHARDLARAIEQFKSN